MSAGKSEEEARLLDEKIAAIRKKNEALLRRRQEIEEDKKLAEQRNAVVQLRSPSTDDWPRERMPPLLPTNREMRDLSGGDASRMPAVQQFESPVRQTPRESRGGSNRSREIMEKGAGPPPDPRSFLADPDRDPRTEYARQKMENANSSPQTDNSFGGPGQGQGFREYQRGGSRRGSGRGSRRDESGWGGQSGSFGRCDDAWREERHKIDEARIQRQKAADGKWRREWDNEKLEFELEVEDNKNPPVTSPRGLNSRLDRIQNRQQQPQNMGLRDSRQHQSDSLPSPRAGRGRGLYQRGGGGGGRGFRVQPESPPPQRTNHSSESLPFAKEQEDTPSRIPKKSLPVRSPGVPHTPSARPTKPGYVSPSSGNRMVTNEDVTRAARVEVEPRWARRGRRRNDNRTRERGNGSRTSNSSFSEDDEQIKISKKKRSPKEPMKFEPMSFTIKNELQTARTDEIEQLQLSMKRDDGFLDTSKPPLPPFRKPAPKPVEIDAGCKGVEGEESWEDMTSGTESIDSLPVTPSPKRVGTDEAEAPCVRNHSPGRFIALVQPDENAESIGPGTEHCNFIDTDIIEFEKGPYSPDDFIVLVRPIENSEQDISTDNEQITQVLDANVIQSPDDFITLLEPSVETAEPENINSEGDHGDKTETVEAKLVQSESVITNSEGDHGDKTETVEAKLVQSESIIINSEGDHGDKTETVEAKLVQSESVITNNEGDHGDKTETVEAKLGQSESIITNSEGDHGDKTEAVEAKLGQSESIITNSEGNHDDKTEAVEAKLVQSESIIINSEGDHGDKTETVEAKLVQSESVITNSKGDPGDKTETVEAKLVQSESIISVEKDVDSPKSLSERSEEK